jgi:uncharacterized protein (DUF2141 family)
MNFIINENCWVVWVILIKLWQKIQPLKIRTRPHFAFGGIKSAFHPFQNETNHFMNDITDFKSMELFMSNRFNFKNILFHTLVMGILPALPTTTFAADLIVIVGNVQQDSGDVMLGLFANNPADFPKSISKGISTPARQRDAQGRVRLIFPSLPPGDYAATAYHDLNGDQKLTTNLMKLPTEPYGFSNNARSSFGPPSFKDAAITLGEENLTIEIQMK